MAAQASKRLGRRWHPVKGQGHHHTVLVKEVTGQPRLMGTGNTFPLDGSFLKDWGPSLICYRQHSVFFYWCWLFSVPSFRSIVCAIDTIYYVWHWPVKELEGEWDTYLQQISLSTCPWVSFILQQHVRFFFSCSNLWAFARFFVLWSHRNCTCRDRATPEGVKSLLLQNLRYQLYFKFTGRWKLLWHGKFMWLLNFFQQEFLLSG